MDTAARAPTNQTSLDKMHNAAVNEREPTSTSNMGVAGPPTTSTISTTTTTTKTTGGPTDNAPGYLQQARETLASFADSVQQAVGIETPASTLRQVAHNTKIQASMPSTETTGAQPGEHCDGVGALPGSNKEEGVARLPAERLSVPSREFEGAYPGEKSGGVGALPGPLNESSVALLPDERKERDAQRSVQAVAHPLSKHLDMGDIKTAAAHPVETTMARRSSSSSLSSSSSEGVERAPGVPKKKTTLKDKLTGGMKTAMGKMKHDDELILEGKAQRGH